MSTTPQVPSYFLYNFVVRYADQEVPKVVNPTTLTVRYQPVPYQSLQLAKNGLLQTAGQDYTIAGNTITLLVATDPDNDSFICWYRY